MKTAMGFGSYAEEPRAIHYVKTATPTCSQCILLRYTNANIDVQLFGENPKRPKHLRGFMDCKISKDGSLNRFCASLEENDLSVLCSHCSKREFARGQMLYKEDIKSNIYIVIKGYLVAYAPYDEDEYFQGNHPGMGIHTEGDVFSCDLVCSPKKAEDYKYYRIHAQTSTKAFSSALTGRLPVYVVRDLFASSLSFARELFRCNIEMFGASCELASALRVGTMEETIKYLLSFSKANGIEMTHQQMADISGFNRASISRAVTKIYRMEKSFLERLEKLEPTKVV